MSHNPKTRINLYSANLLPPKLRLSFKRLSFFSILALVVAFGGWGTSYWFLNQAQAQLTQVKETKRQLDEQKSQLEQELNARVPEPSLVERAKLEQQQLELKRLLLGELSKREALTSRGYSQLLTELAKVSDPSIWLERIQASEQSYIFHGYGQHPESLPLWLEKLKSTESLKGQAFATMTMDRGEGEPLAFSLSSSQAEPNSSEVNQ